MWIVRFIGKLVYILEGLARREKEAFKWNVPFVNVKVGCSYVLEK